MAGDEEADRLVADLLVGQAVAGLLVGDLDQHADQVLAAGRAPALGDQRVQDRVEQLQAALEAAGRGQRQPGGVDHRGQGRVGEGQDVADGRPDPVDVAPPVGLEQRRGQVGQADPDHLRLDLQRPAGLGVGRPGVEHLGGGLDELPPVALQGVAPEGRLGHPPGADPAGPLGPDQAAADDRLEPVADERGPRVVGRVVLEHLLDRVRVGQQVEGQRPPEADRVAVARARPRGTRGRCPGGSRGCSRAAACPSARGARGRPPSRPARPPSARSRGSALPGGTTCLPLPSASGNRRRRGHGFAIRSGHAPRDRPLQRRLHGPAQRPSPPGDPPAAGQGGRLGAGPLRRRGLQAAQLDVGPLLAGPGAGRLEGQQPHRRVA